MDEQLVREYIKVVKSEKRRRAQEGLGKVFRVLGNAFPRGIRHPDSLITNRHLYFPGRRGVTRLR